MLTDTQDLRLTTLYNWLATVLPTTNYKITPIKGDASFRRYFRLQMTDKKFIVMDAPPDRENVRPFVAIAKAFAKLGVEVPHIYAADFENGFLLLSDLGDELYLSLLNDLNVDYFYQQALDVLPRIQACKEIPDWHLPDFDRIIIEKEWRLFHEWHLQTHWHMQINVHEQHLLAKIFDFLLNEILKQPRVCVHRDFHSRNLLNFKGKVGVLDFQDAVWGPVVYDAVSLLRDCYVAWPREQVINWILVYYDQVRDQGLLKNMSRDAFMRDFDLVSVQRHLKVLGIFTRLNYLYGKPDYLNDVPRTLNYVLEVSDNHPELKEFKQFLLR